MKGRYTGYIISFLCGTGLLILGLAWQDLHAVSGSRDWVRVFSNAALFPGVMLTGAGLLVWIEEEGLFEGIKYAISSMFIHKKGEPKRYADYYAYIHRERKAYGTASLLVPGGGFLLAALVLTAVYYII